MSFERVITSPTFQGQTVFSNDRLFIVVDCLVENSCLSTYMIEITRIRILLLSSDVNLLWTEWERTLCNYGKAWETNDV